MNGGNRKPCATEVVRNLFRFFRNAVKLGNTERSSSTIIRDININGIKLKIIDFSTSIITQSVPQDLEHDHYNIENIDFQPGDIIIDIGANVGIVSIYVAKKFPFVKVLAFEPVTENYQHFCQNLSLNGVNNVIPHNLAVTKDGRCFDMIAHLASNSGGGTGHLRDMRLPGHSYYTVNSTTLDRIFEDNRISFCRLLKIDCEGSEHEILWNAHSLDKVEYLSGEFHINQHLDNAGYSIESLIERCQEFVDPSKMKITTVHMAE